MRRVIAISALALTLLGVSAPAAQAGQSTDIALGLASFAVFNQVVGPLLNPNRFDGGPHRRHVVYQTVVREPRVVYYEAPAPVVYAPPAAPPAYPTVVQYPHGRYELRLQGAQYVWVWIPAVPPPPPPPAP